MRVLCVTSVRNEAPFLLEWIAHHQNIGVTDFLIFSNDCEDGTHEMLEALQAQDVVVHVPQEIEEGVSPQWQALRAAWKHPLRKACDWALVCDVDEFVNIHVGQGRLSDLLDALPGEVDGILMPWRLFGSNRHAFYEDKPVTELFTASMAPECNYPVDASFFKSMFRTDGPFNQFGVHRPKQKSPEKARLPVWVNGGGQRMPEIFARHPQRLSLYGFPDSRALVECNHYSLKSAESFMVKRARGLPNRADKNIDLGYWIERNFNTEENSSILRMRTGTKESLDALMTAELAQLHEHAVKWHRQKFMELMKGEEEHRLFSQLMIACGSQCPPQEITRTLISLYQPIYRAKQVEKQRILKKRQ